MNKKKIRRNTLVITGIIVGLSIAILLVLLLLYPRTGSDKLPANKSKDKVAPVISGVIDRVVERNGQIDLLENVTATDNISKHVSLTVEGEYDLSRAGTYNLKVVAKDTNGNTSEEKFTLVVKEPEPIVNEADGATYIDDILIINKTYGVPSTFEPSNLVSIGKAKMVDYAAEAMRELIGAAGDEGLNIFTMTGYRSYSFQASIYNGYLKEDPQEEVDTYSARPGYSEHHSGLAVDVNSLEQSWGNTPEGKWLNANCYKYGFIIRYPYGKDDITGYMYEPWHVRYVGNELAEILYNDGNWLTLEEYFNITSAYE